MFFKCLLLFQIDDLEVELDIQEPRHPVKQEIEPNLSQAAIAQELYPEIAIESEDNDSPRGYYNYLTGMQLPI